MEQPLSARQRRIVDLAGELAMSSPRVRRSTIATPRFRSSTTTACAMPATSGYDPRGARGLGANLLEMVLAQERLAMGCGATALAVTMHVSPLAQLGILAAHRRRADRRVPARRGPRQRDLRLGCRPSAGTPS